MSVSTFKCGLSVMKCNERADLFTRAEAEVVGYSSRLANGCCNSSSSFIRSDLLKYLNKCKQDYKHSYLQKFHCSWAEMGFPEVKHETRSLFEIAILYNNNSTFYNKDSYFFRHFKRKSCASNERCSGMGGCDFVVPM